MAGSSADLHPHQPDIELMNNSSKLSPSDHSNVNVTKSQNEQEEAHYVEVTMEVQGESVALQSIKTVAGSDNMEEEGEGEKLGLTTGKKKLEKKTSFGASVMQSATTRIKQLKRLASFSKPEPEKQLARTKSAVAHALTGLKFISKTDGGAGWGEVEKEFDKLTASTDGYLPRALFAKCIGTKNPDACIMLYNKHGYAE